MYPSISAILPNYNYSKYFSSRLDEILNQTYPVSEVIILDDASTDDSRRVIEEKVSFSKQVHKNIDFKFLYNSVNSGNVFSQWQKGIKLATSDYIWIAELDDSCSLDFLKTILRLIKKDSSIILSYSNSKLIGNVTLKDQLRQLLDLSRRRHFPGSYVVSGKTELEKNLAIFNSVPNVSACVFKNLPNLLNILEGAKNYGLCGDWYFYSKLAEMGDIAYTPKKLNSHRLSKESVTSQTTLRTRFEEIQRIHSEIIASNTLPQKTLKRIRDSETKLKRAWDIV